MDIFSLRIELRAYFFWYEFYRHPEKTKAVQVPFLILLLLFYFRVLLIKFILSNFRSTNINLFETRNLHSPTIVRGTFHQSTLDLSIIKCTPGSNVFIQNRTEAWLFRLFFPTHQNVDWHFHRWRSNRVSDFPEKQVL